MKTHRIEPGDWLGAIADRYGFDHWSTLWEHPANASLRELRTSPNMVMVGDEVSIPEADERSGVEVTAGQRVTFKVHGPDMLRVRLPSLLPFIKAFGPVPYELTLGDRTITGELTEAGEALIETPLLPTDTKATLKIMDTEVGEYAIGGLGPVSEGKGAYARLQNLGYGNVPTGGGDREQAGDPLVEALLAFQRSEGRSPSGELDDATQQRLVQRYGA